MRAREFISEGVFDDLRAIGQAQRARASADLGQRLQNYMGSITPQWYKDLASSTADKLKQTQTAAVTDAWLGQWEKEFKRMEQANGGPFGDDQYRGLFRSWLEKTARVKIDPDPLKTHIPVQSMEAVRNYFDKHFIPKYIETQSNPIYMIPDGETVDVVTQVGSRRSGTRYTWVTSRGRWADQRGTEVPTYTQLHIDLTQQAMEKSMGTTGGAGERTI